MKQSSWAITIFIILMLHTCVTRAEQSIDLTTTNTTQNDSTAMKAVSFIRSSLSGVALQLQKWLSNIEITLVDESRTFGRIKRLQQAMLPIMFSMGVMATLILLLVLMTKKILLIAITLLVLNIAAIVAKLAFLAKSHLSGGVDHHHQHDKGIHIHLHNSPNGYQAPPLYNGWQSAGPEVQHEGYSNGPYNYHSSPAH